MNLEQRRLRQRSLREAWFAEGLAQVAAADIVFFDPDNGLAPSNVSKHSKASAKYVFLDELKSCLANGKSVVLYQHRNRVKDQICTQFVRMEGCCGGWALRFCRRSVRIYLILPASAAHRTTLASLTDAFMASRWGQDGHFTYHGD